MTIQGQVFRAERADRPALPVEIAFLQRYGLAEELLWKAVREAAAAGVGADQALIKNGHIEETLFYRALATELGIRFLDRALCLAGHVRFPEAALAGVAPLASDDAGPRFVLAPREDQVTWLLSRERPLGADFAMTTPSRLNRAAIRGCALQIAHWASHELAEKRPAWSSKDGLFPAQRAFAAIAVAALSFLGGIAPGETFAAAAIASGLVFVGMVLVRLAAAHEAIPVRAQPIARWPDHLLPVYTIIVPLRREKRVLDRLIRGLGDLDYPKPKLDIKLVIEADDREMMEALAARKLPPSFEVIVAPPGQPRTKPRALNVALPLARGELVVVYDAEDVPDQSQLRLAVATFAHASPDVACLQARLVIDNTDDNWLTRLFTIEYAALFDVVNPALARFDFPVPLGGTSNHFRTSALRALHGWDAWSVTEDADLGIRLAVAGYRVLDLPSSTLEEAPSTFAAWLKQRTRWMKGFMQVLVTHSRKPLFALRALGPIRFFGAVTMTLGPVATALGYPVFTAASLYGIWSGSLVQAATIGEAVWAGVGLTLFSGGLAAMAIPAIVGLKRRGWYRLLIYVPLLPFYYVLISLAAWRAVFEFIRDPFGWHKTEHGVARTSRSGLLTTGGADPGRPLPEAGRG